MTDEELTTLLGEVARTEPMSNAWADGVRTLSSKLQMEPELAGEPIMLRNALGAIGLTATLPQKMVQAARTSGDPAAVVAWFRKIPNLLRGRASGGAVKALYGITCTEAVPLDKDIVLIPFEQLGPSSTRDWLIAAHERSPEMPSLEFLLPPRAALYRAGTIDQLTAAHSEDFSKFPPLTWFRDLDVAAFLLALAAKAVPVEAARWFYYDDPDVARLCELGHSRQGSEFTHAGHFSEVQVTQESIPGLLPAYRRMIVSDRDRIELALQRLIRSRSQFIPGNRAIDLAITLEVLFMNKESTEHTHKISLRVARLVGNTLDQRRTVYDQVKHLYGMRSSMVHEGSASGPWKINGTRVNASDLVEAVDFVCTESIRKLIAEGAIPTRDQWRDRELA